MSALKGNTSASQGPSVVQGEGRASRSSAPLQGWEGRWSQSVAAASALGFTTLCGKGD